MAQQTWTSRGAAHTEHPKVVGVLAALVAGIAITVAGFGGVAQAKPGNGNANGKVSATLTASPNPAQAGGETFDLDGCGYDTSTDVDFVLHTDSNMWFWSVAVDGDGCIHDTQRTEQAGTYLVEAYQQLHGKKHTLMADTELTVIE